MRKILKPVIKAATQKARAIVTEDLKKSLLDIFIGDAVDKWWAKNEKIHEEEHETLEIIEEVIEPPVEEEVKVLSGRSRRIRKTTKRCDCCD